MPFKTLLVHADTDQRLNVRVTLAAAIAREHGARLMVVYPIQPLLTSMFYAEHVPVQAIQAHIEIERRNAAEVQAGIADRMAREGVPWEWRTVEGQLESVLASSGAVADLVVMGQDEREYESPMVATVALTAGRPVLCVPHGGTFASCGRRVLLAWNGSRESARAAHDALPFLQRAENVVLFAAEPSFRSPEDDRAMRLRWYEYVDKGPKPSVILLQDLDALPGYGSFWGEVQSHVHRGLGALGVVTNGCVRDIPMNARGFQMLAGSVMPSHAYVHVVDVGVPVSICGMSAKSGDLIHADMHGAVVIPLDVAKKIGQAAKLLARREAVIIGASKKKGFSFETLAKALKQSADIH